LNVVRAIQSVDEAVRIAGVIQIAYAKIFALLGEPRISNFLSVTPTPDLANYRGEFFVLGNARFKSEAPSFYRTAELPFVSDFSDPQDNSIRSASFTSSFSSEQWDSLLHSNNLLETFASLGDGTTLTTRSNELGAEVASSLGFNCVLAITPTSAVNLR
jgi:hypothetical protein